MNQKRFELLLHPPDSDLDAFFDLALLASVLGFAVAKKTQNRFVTCGIYTEIDFDDTEIKRFIYLRDNDIGVKPRFSSVLSQVTKRDSL